MQRPLIHDEHQFVAPAALLVEEGWLPYLDLPHFHMPYLVFAYGGLFLASDHLLMTARLLSVACAWLTLVLIFAAGWRVLGNVPPWRRLGLALGGVALLIFNPLFVQASGMAWNHDLPVLLTVGALLAMARGLRRSTAGAELLLAGLLLSLAAGVRLSFATLAAPFLILAVLRPPRPPADGRGRRLALLLTGMLVGAAILWYASVQLGLVWTFGNFLLFGMYCFS